MGQLDISYNVYNNDALADGFYHGSMVYDV